MTIFLTALVAILTSAGTTGAVKVWLDHRARVRMREIDVDEANAQREHVREESGQHVLLGDLGNCRRRVDALESKVGELVERVIDLTGKLAGSNARIAHLERGQSTRPPDSGRDTAPDLPSHHARPQPPGRPGR